MRIKFPALALAVFALASCSYIAPGGEAVVSISLSLAGGAARSADTRTIPADLDGIYLQAVQDGSVVTHASTSVAPGASSAAIAMIVRPGTYDLHVFAVRDGTIIGIAGSMDTELSAGATTSLQLTMEATVFELPSSTGQNPDIAFTPSYYISSIPYEFMPFFMSGDIKLYVKRNLDYNTEQPPTGWNDATFIFPAMSDDSDGFFVSGEIPATTFATNQAAYCWFVVSWPGCPVVFAFNKPTDAMKYNFNW